MLYFYYMCKYAAANNNSNNNNNSKHNNVAQLFLNVTPSCPAVFFVWVSPTWRARAHARPAVWGMACLPSAGQWRYNSGSPEGCWCCSCARLIMENWDLGFITNLVRNHWNLPCETWLRCICLGLCLDLTRAVKAAFSKHYFWCFILEILTPKQQQPRKRASACENTLWCFGLHKHIKGWKTVPRARSDALNVLVHSVHLICWAYWCSRWNILQRTY